MGGGYPSPPEVIGHLASPAMDAFDEALGHPFIELAEELVPPVT